MNYRPEIDGLRAVAVLSVFVFHLFPAAFPGGFLGVDVFFVISGFLIAKVLKDQVDEKRFSFRGFFMNRVRRLFPLMALVTGSTLLASYFFLLPQEYVQAAKAAASALLFVSNLHFASLSGYFGPDIAHNPFLHTWSLSVEEQFYLFFPIVFVALTGFGSKVRLVVLGALALISFLWGVKVIGGAWPFFGLHARAWELLAGVVAALWLQDRAAGWPLSMRRILAFLGVTFLLIGFCEMSAKSVHPGPLTAVPVLGTILLLLCAGRDTLVGQILSWRLLVHVGLISYALYLWHQPVIVFVHVYLDAKMTIFAAIFSFFVAYIFAVVSTRWIEKPFRKGGWIKHLTFLRFLMISLILLLLCGIIAKKEGFPNRVESYVLSLSNPKKEILESLKHCHFLADEEFEKPCWVNTDDLMAPKIAVFGDSHAKSLFSGILPVFSDYNLTLMSGNTCRPSFRYTRLYNRDACANMIDRYLSELDNEEVDILVLHSRWADLMNGSVVVNNGEGGVETGNDRFAFVRRDGSRVDTTTARAEFIEDLSILVDDFIKKGGVVVLVYGVPEMGWSVPKEASRRAWKDGKAAPLVSVSEEFFKSRTDFAHTAFDSFADHRNLIRVRPSDIFCREKRCYGEENGEVLYVDDDHLGDVGAHKLATFVRQKMYEAGAVDLLHTSQVLPTQELLARVKRASAPLLSK